MKLRTFHALCSALAALVVLLTLPVATEAAPLRSATAKTAPEELFNPVPAADDLVLPMPCNLSMVLKAVEIPSRGLLWDTPFNMGSETPAEAGLEFYDRRFPASLSAPFTFADLPKPWQTILKSAESRQHTYYLIGKYEVSVGQWEAVMTGTCPAPTPENARPKTDISWYDAQEFTRRYTQWLLENAPDALPHFTGDERNVGFVRLPTEAEWEYAARGGNRVRQESLLQEPFPPMESGTTLEDYAVFRTDTAVQEGALRIGSRKPNPLGLHDMSGNVAEMVQEAFRFSLGGRLHGAAGGFIRKGGSYSSTRTGIEPGRREEVALFNARGPVSAADLGLRVAVSGINTPGGERAQALLDQWKVLGDEGELASQEDAQKNAPQNTPHTVPQTAPKDTQTTQPGTPADPATSAPLPPLAPDAPALAQLDALLAAELDPKTREPLAKLRSRLKDDSVALERQRNASTGELIRTLLYLEETVRNYGVRRELAHSRMLEIRGMLSLPDKELAAKTRMPRADIEKAAKDFATSAKEQKAAMDAAANFYRTRLDELSRLPRAMVTYNLDLIREELRGEDRLTVNMRDNLKTLETHLANLRAGRTALLTRERLIRDILPDHLEEGL